MEEWWRAGTKFMMAANMHKTRNDKIRHLTPFHFNGSKLIRKVSCHCKCQALLSQETYGDTLRPKQLVWLHFRQNEKHPHPRRKLKKGSGIVLRQTPWCHSHWKRRVCPCILGGVWIFIMPDNLSELVLFARDCHIPNIPEILLKPCQNWLRHKRGWVTTSKPLPSWAHSPNWNLAHQCHRTFKARVWPVLGHSSPCPLFHFLPALPPRSPAPSSSLCLAPNLEYGRPWRPRPRTRLETMACPPALAPPSPP